MPDANLKPEFVFSYEAGAEFQLFNNRVNFDIAAFRQKSVGSILTVKVPASSGFPFLRLNVGETKNWGYEVDLRVQIVRKANINWEISGNYGFNDNRAEKLFEGVNEFALPGGFAHAQPYVIQGQSYPALKATAYLRDSATGRIIVGSKDGYPLQTPDLKSFGRTTPKHVAGLGTKVRVKDFSLAANAEYRGGNVIFHQLGRDMTFTGSGKWTENRAPFILPNSSFDDGTGKFVPNTTVNVQEAEYAYYVDKYRFISENFVTPGWFIKLRDVNLSYNFPSRLMNKTKVFSGATVGIYGRNLFTIVDKLNMYTDPEFSTSTGNGQGINDSRNTPPVKQFGFNVNLTF
ncbi:MAG: TonB-dependent receptor [Chitinophagaceae bacterium]